MSGKAKVRQLPGIQPLRRSTRRQLVNAAHAGMSNRQRVIVYRTRHSRHRRRRCYGAGGVGERRAAEPAVPATAYGGITGVGVQGGKAGRHPVPAREIVNVNSGMRKINVYLAHRKGQGRYGTKGATAVGQNQPSNRSVTRVNQPTTNQIRGQ